MTINVTGWPISEKEIAAYQHRGMEKYGDKLTGIDIKILDKENV